MRREFRATCGYLNIFCHKMITSGWILMFHMSIEPYWLAQDDWIFENDATAFLVAKIGPKWIPYIWVVWRPTELKSGNQAAEINYRIILNRYYRPRWSSRYIDHQYPNKSVVGCFITNPLHIKSLVIIN